MKPRPTSASSWYRNSLSSFFSEPQEYHSLCKSVWLFLERKATEDLVPVLASLQMQKGSCQITGCVFRCTTCDWGSVRKHEPSHVNHEPLNKSPICKSEYWQPAFEALRFENSSVMLWASTERRGTQPGSLGLAKFLLKPSLPAWTRSKAGVRTPKFGLTQKKVILAPKQIVSENVLSVRLTHFSYF